MFEECIPPPNRTPMKQEARVLLKKAQAVLRGILLFTLCSSYFLYLDLLFYSGTLGDEKSGCYGSPTAALEVEAVALQFQFPMLIAVVLLFLFWGRAHWLCRIVTILIVVPTLLIFLCIQGIGFVGAGVTHAF